MNKGLNPQSPYYQQVKQLVQVLPIIAQEAVFALKGGTAINLFVREFPRLALIGCKLHSSSNSYLTTSCLGLAPAVSSFCCKLGGFVAEPGGIRLIPPSWVVGIRYFHSLNWGGLCLCLVLAECNRFYSPPHAFPASLGRANGVALGWR